MKKIIDSHIHLDQYENKDLEYIINHPSLDALITVSNDLQSSKRNKELAERFKKVKPAYGYHPEQSIPTETELAELISWIDKHHKEMIAVGEVGLPYYLRREERVPIEPYIELLEEFMTRSKRWQKPIVLHAVYDDAKMVCDLLEKHSIQKAHFHWFKGDEKTIERMIANGYYISITPDVLYEHEIKKLVERYPLKQMMVETDGPWPFEGPFCGEQTNSKMIHQSIEEIARIKRLQLDDVYACFYKNTNLFYQLSVETAFSN